MEAYPSRDGVDLLPTDRRSMALPLAQQPTPGPKRDLARINRIPIDSWLSMTVPIIYFPSRFICFTANGP
ncbi:hypothetical protein M514_03005 [Trichuris suis]|uniref:Uncharacterized protein n=1 Tax=Trichuris suis TaxID=68888 RepID=A0A085MG81_9BILA|nr:hypothetical protein M513_03005 [Trichuris suis]KFD69112.1 hypothetical protein M514_03005 [Trichuris suis]